MRAGGLLRPDAAAAAPADSPDGTWSVSTVDGGFQVTLYLTKQLDARDAVPELAVDGTPVGFARQSRTA